MKKSNYSMERKGRENAKQAKATAKLEKRTGRDNESRQSDAVPTSSHADPAAPDPQQPSD